MPTDQDSAALLTVVLENPETAAAVQQWQFSGVETDEVWLGRSLDNEIQFDIPALSRKHAKVCFESGRWVFHDLGRNPSLLDGEPIDEPVTLVDATIIQLSRNGPRLRFEASPSAPPLEAEDTVEEDRAQQVTLLLQDLAAGDDDAAAHLWELYFRRVAQVAKLKLSPSLRRVTDEEDVAASVFESLFTGVTEGKFAELASRDNLWRLLSVMTARKAADHAQHQLRAKRGGGQVRGESVFIDEDGASGIAEFVAITSNPQFQAQFAEEVEQRLKALDNDTLRDVARLKLEGYTNEEIAERLGCNSRTVQRRLQDVRAVWSDGHG